MSDSGGHSGLRAVRAVNAVVDGVQIVAVLRGDEVTILTNLAGSLCEVGRGRWDGTRFECCAWVGRDEEHQAMLVGAIADALTKAAAADLPASAAR